MAYQQGLKRHLAICRLLGKCCLAPVQSSFQQKVIMKISGASAQKNVRGRNERQRHTVCLLLHKDRAFAKTTVTEPMHAITPPPVSHFDEMLTWSGASPSHLQAQFQTQLQQFGGSTQSQSQLQTQKLGPRDHYVPYGNWLADTPSASLTQRRAQADLLFRRIGITFTVYGDEGGTERLPQVTT